MAGACPRQQRCAFAARRAWPVVDQPEIEEGSVERQSCHSRSNDPTCQVDPDSPACILGFTAQPAEVGKGKDHEAASSAAAHEPVEALMSAEGSAIPVFGWAIAIGVPQAKNK